MFASTTTTTIKHLRTTTSRLSRPRKRPQSSLPHVHPPQSRAAHTGTTFPLNTGSRIPALGFGTWQDVSAQQAAVTHALRAGYRHVDTARIYGTEAGVGRAIEASGVPRADLFLTSKLWNNAHHPDDVEAQLEASLRDLRTEYLDLWLMHWPSAFARGEELMPRDAGGKLRAGGTGFVDAYRAMEKCLRGGKVRAIGISNFSRAEVEALIREVDVVPAVHQMELHPWLQQKEFADFHKQKGIHITQYSPFGNQNEVYDSGKGIGKLIDDPAIVEIGKKHGKTGAQVALAWGIAKGRSVIPKSKTEERIRENLEGDFALPEEDVRRIDGMDRKLRFNDPSKSFGWNFYADLDGKKT